MELMAKSGIHMAQESNIVNKLEKRNRLFALIRELSFSQRRVVLSSGRGSDFYFDMKPTMLYPEAVGLIAELLFDRVSEAKIDFVGGLELGAIPLLAPLIDAAHKRGRFMPGFLVRKKAKEHGSKKVLEGVDSLEGKNVLILDDVTTSGKSAMDAVRVAQEAGGNVVLVLSIVDRGEGAVEFFREQGIQFASLYSAQDFKEHQLHVANIRSNSG